MAASLTHPHPAVAGAPRHGSRFANPAGPRALPSFPTMAPFFLRKAWTELVPRSGAARIVPFDRAALRHNPGITWIGHSTMLVRMDGVTFLTDPIFSERASPVSFAGPQRLVPPGVPLDELPPIDFVLISHDHYDHADAASIAALAARGARFIVPLGLGELVRANGGTAIELDWWQETSVGPAAGTGSAGPLPARTADPSSGALRRVEASGGRVGSLRAAKSDRLEGAGAVTVHCVPAQHFCGRSLTDGNHRLWAGWVVEGPTRRFYHAGDTGYFDGFAEIGRRLGPIDLAAIPIGAYDPPAIMHAVHINPEEAVQAARDLGARRVVGMHFGTFDLTDEPLDEPPRRFHAAAAQQGFDPEHAWTLNVGETRSW